MSLTLAEHRNFVEDMDLPEQVKIVEVGPRDGLQNQARSVPVDTKVSLINQLSLCGLNSIEVGSLVSARQVPQMSDSDRVFREIDQHPDKQYIMLLANQKGFDRVVKAGAKHIAVFCAASDAFSQNNVHCNVAESLNIIQAICEQAIDQGLLVRGYVSCVLGCPYQGVVSIESVKQVAEQLYKFGCDEISLGDTIGAGTAGQVKSLIQVVSGSIPPEQIAVHFHDTCGQALANILTALQCGISIVDSSVSGLGGCPFAPGATGNVATEDLVYLLNGLGIKTGIDLPKLIETSHFISERLQRSPSSRTALAFQHQMQHTVRSA